VAVRAAAEAGALGTILSGSGSTVLSFVRHERAALVAAALTATYTRRGIAAAVRVIGFDNDGLTALP
jgi:homoserine kinase